MDALGSSECSSGCESGWTLYLDDHSFNPSQSHTTANSLACDDEFCCYEKNKEDKKTQSDEEDLSMVSDASSGPPSHFNAPQHYSVSQTPKLTNRSKKRQKVQENNNILDDTASSPLFDFSMNNVTTMINNQQTEKSMLDCTSQGFSATYFEVRSSTLQDHFAFLQNEAHNNNK